MRHITRFVIAGASAALSAACSTGSSGGSDSPAVDTAAIADRPAGKPAIEARDPSQAPAARETTTAATPVDTPYPTRGAAERGTPPIPPTQPPERATTGEGGSQTDVQRLERELRALVKADGCSSTGECKAVPVGAKACGGPRYYLPYCTRTTDERALLAKADELRKAEEAYNRDNQMVSTCEFIGPPALTVSGRTCRAAGTGAP
ncbi:MAG: hypothetical protein M3373_01710 [Gemmatimonadota bacterium]|nr:hypothetical protein [Gemmatimonadota bacterium]